ncbi:DoxX family protein [Halorarum salinum]|uniref:DoxX family protein n=1 Tax=Halorarum salinum TaxID=2743089 RepID=A0A7D5QBA8_9EURY|nr:DoxX family protein [Halobaculum salinum]QLG63017.1 DoxX family protein [Halobaculum salinum]
MVQTISRSLVSVTQVVPHWVRLLIRLSIAAVVAKPALSKFLTHESSVAFFSRIGIPFPNAMVVIAGTIQITAVVMLVLGISEDLAALSLVPVMLVAIAYVGPDWKNLAVIGGSLAIIVLRTGADSPSSPLGLRRG